MNYFLTGFPGFLAAQILKYLLDFSPSSHFMLLVYPSQMNKAEKEVEQLIFNNPKLKEYLEIIPGDITKENLGISKEILKQIQSQTDYFFHLAAVYDLAVPQNLAYQVNVEGTKNVNHLVRNIPELKRYLYFSTAYVSGKRNGKILETELDQGQSFKNHYEATKFEAEKLVQELYSRVPTTIIRPGIVMGDSRTGETIKFDGPYFMMRFLDQFRYLPIPYIGKGEAPINLVPVDYVVKATVYLAHHQKSKDKVYHLTDPNPFPIRKVYDMICNALIGKKPSWTIPLSLVSAALSIPVFRRFVKVEQQTIDYFISFAEYDTTNAVTDLEGSGIHCPDLTDYIETTVNFYKNHREDPDKMILVK